MTERLLYLALVSTWAGGFLLGYWVRHRRWFIEDARAPASDPPPALEDRAQGPYRAPPPRAEGYSQELAPDPVFENIRDVRRRVAAQEARDARERQDATTAYLEMVSELKRYLVQAKAGPQETYVALEKLGELEARINALETGRRPRPVVVPMTAPLEEVLK